MVVVAAVVEFRRPAAESGWRIRAMVGGGDAVRVLKRVIRSRVAGSLV